jgi:hypothetical protein
MQLRPSWWPLGRLAAKRWEVWLLLHFRPPFRCRRKPLILNLQSSYLESSYLESSYPQDYYPKTLTVLTRPRRLQPVWRKRSHPYTSRRP